MSHPADASAIVLFGGDSRERFVSVASTQNIAAALPESRFWFWDPSGAVTELPRDELMAHANPFLDPLTPRRPPSFTTIAAALDSLVGSKTSIMVGLHGGSGEDGTLQQELEARHLRFTGSGSAACSAAMDKPRAKAIVRGLGIMLAEQLTFSTDKPGAHDDLRRFQAQFARIVVKPSREGSSVGLAFASSTAELDAWWDANAASSEPWLAEEFLAGREFTVGVAMHRGSLLVLPPSEVILERDARFDYAGKYLGKGNREVTPAELTPRQTADVQLTVATAHRALGCYGYTRSEVIMTARGIFFLETNTLPGLAKPSFIPQQLAAAGIPFVDFLRCQLDLAAARYD